METGAEAEGKIELSPQKANAAVALLLTHVDIIVCSYFATDVFKEFLHSLPEETRLAIEQLMASVNSKLPTQPARKRFGSVLLGERERRFKCEDEYPEDVHSTGLLDGDDTLLRGFFKVYPQFAEYVTLIPNNPYYTSALGVASDNWKYMHPDPPVHYKTQPPSRILVNDAGVSIRGGCFVAMRRNLEYKFPPEEWQAIIVGLERLVSDICEVLHPTSGSFTPRLLGRFSVSSVDIEKKVVALAHRSLGTLSLLSPHLDPLSLFKEICSAAKLIRKDLERIIGDHSVWPGTKVKLLRDGVLRFIKAMQAIKKAK